jgi:hypothetical protein
MLNINSGEEYANLLVKTLKESQKDLPEELLKKWCWELYTAAVDSFKEYLVGKRDDYLLTQDELEECYNKAGIKYSEGVLNSLIDTEHIQASITPEGDIVYSATEKSSKRKKGKRK